jgi:hypothetical protein
VEERDNRDDRRERERRAEDLRRTIQDFTRGGAGERPRPTSPHEFIEEQMREEAERVEEGGEAERVEEGEEGEPEDEDEDQEGKR